MSSSPHKCPICEGKGEVTRKLAQVGSVVVQQKPLLFRCHGCQGQGLIWDPAPTITFPMGDLNPPINNQPFWTTGNRYTLSNSPIQDGVIKCEDCKEPLYMNPAKGCKRASSHLQSLAHYVQS